MHAQKPTAVLNLVALLSFQLAATQTWSAQSDPRAFSREQGNEEEQIPKLPSAPPHLGYDQMPVENFRCERTFIYRGKPLSCDSIVRHDAEGLRPILQTVPEAVSQLNLYQENRREVRDLAYVGTAGLLVAVLGWVISTQFRNPDGNTSDTGNSVRNISVISGLGVAGGSLLYGFSLLRTNEQHLGTAVDLYNRAYPNDPVQLQFSTGITF